jgi:hypothetical protein
MSLKFRPLLVALLVLPALALATRSVAGACPPQGC